MGSRLREQHVQGSDGSSEHELLKDQGEVKVAVRGEWYRK